MLKYVPNALTILRFLLIPIIVIACVQEEYILAMIILTISGLTDILDGTIARKFNLITDFGKLMDPLADKATQLSLLTTLFLKGMLPVWILIIVVIKEFCMVSGASFLYGKDVVVYSRWYGKLATVLFYLAIVSSLLLQQYPTNTWYSHIDLFLYYLALISTLFALLMYIKTLHDKGFINKNDLKKDVTVEKKERKKKANKSETQ